jgi:argininosuccinate lyase
VGLGDLTLDEYRSVQPAIDERIRAVLTVEASVASRRSEGGTSPERVGEAVAAARERFL